MNILIDNAASKAFLLAQPAQSTVGTNLAQAAATRWPPELAAFLPALELLGLVIDRHPTLQARGYLENGEVHCRIWDLLSKEDSYPLDQLFTPQAVALFAVARVWLACAWSLKRVSDRWVSIRFLNNCVRGAIGDAYVRAINYHVQDWPTDQAPDFEFAEIEHARYERERLDLQGWSTTESPALLLAAALSLGLKVEKEYSANHICRDLYVNVSWAWLRRYERYHGSPKAKETFSQRLKDSLPLAALATAITHQASE